MAYSNLFREAETMGQSVLANQFVVGLCSELKWLGMKVTWSNCYPRQDLRRLSENI